jgi:hypothetical protein
MLRNMFGVNVLALALAGSVGVAAAQTGSAQPAPNDPPPPAPNHQPAKDTVPPATDESQPTRAGKQEPSSKIEGTAESTTVFVNGTLSVPGADPDAQTAPAKFSQRTNAADQLPIAAYALRHLTEAQRTDLYEVLHKRMALSSSEAEASAVVGAEVSTSTARNVERLPEDIVSKSPELMGLAFLRAGEKVLIVSPTMHRVLAVLG